MRSIRLLAYSLLLLPLPAVAERQVMLERTGPGEFRVAPGKAGLEQVLAQIAEKSAIRLHYSALPKESASADCAGKLESLLPCLLGPQANLAFRYSSAPSGNRQLTEAWILPQPAESDSETGRALATEPAPTVTDNTPTFLEQAKDPQQRMQAIANLAMAGRFDDMQVKAAIKDALKDKDPGVRAQAVLALRQTQDGDAVNQIAQAMHDSNADVRLLATESVGDNALLLQQALTDSDRTIREYAAAKLAALNQSN
ncbi:HEAT repeat domain-containing protein [Methylomonas koyamae]|uniref:HEAT repeat domain-containing protein n=1 Tax=Methylomonas koyamae TaxID=702114 RepID=UPI0006D24E88|nr:HEAT repeat domain-containing protein [Methylomonas koyamae]BBL57184.1 hypothetical protein MKFW12EY_07970 [Methylomonas koyamae]